VTRNARSKGGVHDTSAIHPYFEAIFRTWARCIGMSQESINQEAAAGPVSYGDRVTRVGRGFRSRVTKNDANAWRAMSARYAAGANLARFSSVRKSVTQRHTAARSSSEQYEAAQTGTKKKTRENRGEVRRQDGRKR
jgi:hypothetical protein